MKQNVLVLILFCLLTVVLTGCLEVNIDIGIDRNYNAFLSYKAELDVSGIDPQYHSVLSRALNSIGWHYQEQFGFTASLNTDTQLYTLNMSKRISNSSFKSAFNSLKTMLTNEDMTAFMKVDMSIESFPRQELYYINAMLDIPQILSLSNVEELPPELLSEFDSALETGAGSVTLTMPVSEVLKNSKDVKMQYYLAEMAVPLSFSEQTEFEFAGSLIFMEDGTIGASFDDISEQIISKRNISLLICIIAAVVLLIGIIAVFVRR